MTGTQMDPNGLFQRCAAIAALSARMLDAARADDWREVERLRADAASAIDEMRRQAAAVELTREERVRKFALLTRILADAGRIQELAEPWLQSADRWFSAAASADPFRNVPKK